jgi:hypothetical protein
VTKRTPEEYEMELLHFGVKGMKWGVKKAYIDRVSKRTSHFGRVADGTASKGDKVRTVLTTPFKDMALGGGLKGGAARVDARVKDHLDRVEKGKKNLKDTLALVSGVSVGDIVKGAKLAKQAPK